MDCCFVWPLIRPLYCLMGKLERVLGGVGGAEWELLRQKS